MMKSQNSSDTIFLVTTLQLIEINKKNTGQNDAEFENSDVLQSSKILSKSELCSLRPAGRKL